MKKIHKVEFKTEASESLSPFDSGKYIGEIKYLKKDNFKLPQGKGMFELEDGTIFFCKFSKGFPAKGKGIIFYNNGDKYFGDIAEVSGNRHGKGTYVFVDDCLTYVGEFANNKFHGKGYIKDLSGRVDKVIYEDDKIITTISSKYEFHTDYGHDFYVKEERKNLKKKHKQEIKKLKKEYFK